MPALTLSAELLQGSRASVWSGISCTVVSLLWTSLGGARGCELKEHSSEVCRFCFFKPLFTQGEFAGAWVNYSGTPSFTPTQSQTLPSRTNGRTHERRCRLFFPFYVHFFFSTNCRSNIPVPRRLLLCSLNCKLPEEKLLKPLWWKKKNSGCAYFLVLLIRSVLSPQSHVFFNIFRWVWSYIMSSQVMLGDLLYRPDCYLSHWNINSQVQPVKTTSIVAYGGIHGV